MQFLCSLGNKTAARNKKDKGQDQSAYNVVLNSAALIGPNENASDYLPEACHLIQYSLSNSDS
jgi:hypothetical protein